VTLFPFIARPARHLVVKPRLMKRAAEQLGFELAHRPRPNAATYAAVIRAASLGRKLASCIIDVRLLYEMNPAMTIEACR